MKKLLFLLLLPPSICFAQDWNGTLLGLGTPDNNSASQTNDTAMISTTDWTEYIEQAPRARSYTQLCYRTGTLTGAQPVMKIGVEGVSTSTGKADTVYATGTGECSATFTPAGNNTTTCQTITGTTCALTKGQVFAITIRYSSGTIGASNKPQFATNWAGWDDFSKLQTQASYVWTVIATVYTKVVGVPTVFWGDGTTYDGLPVSNLAGTSLSSANDEAGNAINLPCPSGKTYKIKGLRYFGQTAAAGKSITAQIYAGTNTTPIQGPVTLDSDIQATNAGTRAGQILFQDSSLTALNCGSTYRYTVGTAVATSSFSVGYMDVASANHMSALPLGTSVFYTARSAGGALTDTVTRRAELEPIIDFMDITGGGGIKGQNNVNGGAQ